ncbi:MAG TPA: PD-(D/E)XK nuclease family protein [Burkholderiales bacterium]|jgi:ATP-dependent helicase/nuclease subunit B|nr:PD-(D/E)XK nuclease family protein [Burkholderiales bacterium]
MSEPSAAPLERAAGPGALVERVARDLLEEHRETLPDLGRAVVVLPNLHCASEIARALARTAGRMLRLPRFTTLAEWVAAEPAPAPALPESVREAQLFDALRSRNWVRASDLWPLAAELGALFDDLTRFGVKLPATLEEFVSQLEAAYRARAGEPMQLEARLVHELWHAASAPDAARLGEAALYHLRLAQIAQSADSPLYAVALPEPTPAEDAFFRAYARRAPVRRYRCHSNCDDDSLARLLDAAWPLSVDGPDLRSRARSAAKRLPHSPAAGRLALYGAPGLEHEAQAVNAQVRRWLVEGRSSVAVVALDRLVARRVRALLERAQVMVTDETGWLFSTTSAATVMMRWLDAVSGDFYHQDLLDLLKSPFIAADWQARREAVFEIERVARGHSIVSGLSDYIAAVQEEGRAGAALELLERLRRAARLFHRDRRRSLHDWLELLFGSLAALGADTGLRRDAAGLQLMELLERLARELREVDATFSFGEWRQWLNRRLESAEFRDSGIASPVIFTQLSLTRLRRFDAVVLVGCDDAHLPGELARGAFFNESVREQLGLPTAQRQIAQMRDDLLGLLARTQSALLTWQSMRSGEKNLASPFVERLQVFHELAWGERLGDGGIGALAAAAEVPPPILAVVPAQTRRPAPTARAALLPKKVSASGYNSLLACPYQFHARHLLGLREPQEVREALEKRDYGEHVHRVLKRFHESCPVLSGQPRAQLEQSLARLSDAVFQEATEADYLSHGWLLRWKALIPAYLDWQLERENAGWRFHCAELVRTIDLEIPGGHGLTLEGRIDRVDVRDDGGARRFAVLDYKTRDKDALKRDLKDTGEDVQLAVYAQLVEGEVVEALYLSLDRGTVEPVPLPAEVLRESARAIERLRELFGRLHEGASLPAQGIDAACAWCEMRGLCRRDYWL